ncbi:MAG TPA: hypothetical protein DDW78_04935 [Treponema sp.]|nr:hypothetical protein [Treponema sp.]
MHLAVNVKLPFLWGRSVFRKDSWAHINLIVGPNGSGKTLLAESIAERFAGQGWSVKFLRAEGDRREAESEAFEILQTNAEVRDKIQTVLSGMFGKSIVFKKTEEGNYVPMVINRAWNVEYDLRAVECHGFKEIITLLVALYANTGNSCLIFDEPELHLHPQFQQFFAEELRRVSRRHPKRMYILITHSPFFIDLRFPEELTGVIVCHTNRAPTHIDSLDEKDAQLIRRFLPRFNSYHKQFFFSDNQIFVEGYTDQQLFTNLLPYIAAERGAAGTGIIDVGGKDELGVFCKVCALLGTNSRIITDLDSLFSGKLRDVFCADRRAGRWISRQSEKHAQLLGVLFTEKELQRPVTLGRLIMRLERSLGEIGRELCKEGAPIPESLAPLAGKLASLQQKHGNAENIDTFKTVVLQGVMQCGDDLHQFLPAGLAAKIPSIKNLFSLILAGAAAAGVFILPKGCIEHYYTQTAVLYMPVAAKDKLFHLELEHLLSSPPEVIRTSYAELIAILENACGRHSTSYPV